MNITWTGKQEFFLPKQKEQLDGKFSKLGKLLEVDGKGEKQARIALSHDRNRFRAEITLNYLDHTLVGEHVDDDQFTALNQALERLERQMIKVRDKRRDTKKGPREGWDKTVSANNTPAEPASRASNGASADHSANGRPKVFHVQPEDSKPLTVEEAVLMIPAGEPYMVYHNAGTDRLAVLMRRMDGNFDLVEC